MTKELQLSGTVSLEPVECSKVRSDLETHYADDLPRLVSLWLMSKRSANTRKAYGRAFAKWASFCRAAGVHPLDARRPHADAYARSLDDGPATTAAQALSVASSFYAYAIDLEAAERNPFANVGRPKLDADHSDTEGLTPEQTACLLEGARDFSPRAYVIVTLLYTLGLRVGAVIGADVDDLGYDRGHRTLTIVKKGGKKQKLPLSPLAIDAIETYLDGRTEGPLLATRTGNRIDEPYVWRLIRKLAERCDLPQKGSIHPHVLRHGFITDALEQNVPLHKVQDAAGHADPRTTQRYNRARNRLDGHPAYTVAASMSAMLAELEEAA